MAETQLMHAPEKHEPMSKEAAVHGPGLLPSDPALLDGTVLDLVAAARDVYGPGQPFLSHKEGGAWQSEDFSTVMEKVAAVTNALVASGIKKGDKVAIMSGNRPEWAISDLGILHAGAISVPIYDTLTSHQVAYILNDSGAKLIFVEDAHQLQKSLELFDDCEALERIVVFHCPDGDHRGHVDAFTSFLDEGRDAPEQTKRDAAKRATQVKKTDTATIVYTSGTTGEPKGVMLSHNNLHSNVKAGLMRVPVTPGARCLSFLPLSHCFERVAGYYIMIGAGASIFYAESVAKVPENILEVKPHVMASVPRLYEKMYAKVQANVVSSSFIKRMIFQRALKTGEEVAYLEAEGKPVPPGLKKRYDRAHKLVFSKIHAKMGGELQFFISGGAALSPEVELFFNSLGIRILQGYGLTETTPLVSVNAPGETRFGSVGRVVLGVEVKIAEDGEIMVRGKDVMQGYYNKPDATSDVLSDDGWLATGDIGKLDGDGYLYITDRKKELFVLSNGKNVPPQPIENTLKNEPHIAQVVLIGDGRNYCTALIAPDFEALRTYADANRLGVSTPEDLVQHPKIQELVQREVENANTKLARYEQVKMFRLLPREFTLEAGEITPTMKVKRRVVDEVHSALIEEMYAGVEGAGKR